MSKRIQHHFPSFMQMIFASTKTQILPIDYCQIDIHLNQTLDQTSTMRLYSMVGKFRCSREFYSPERGQLIEAVYNKKWKSI